MLGSQTSRVRARQDECTFSWVAAVITKLSFESEGTTCAATFHRPDDAGRRLPCVVMGHGFTGTQELMEPYARRFVRAGLTALTFDYRGFGASAGEPRQIVSIKKQLADWRAALAFARTLEGVDPRRVAVWGSSLSGGHVINLAAEDPTIAAVVAQVPAIDKSTRGMSAEAREKIARLGLSRKEILGTYVRVILCAVYDAVRGALGLKPYYIGVFGKPGDLAAFTDPLDYGTLARFEAAAPTWQNRFAPRFLFGVPRYEPGTAERIQAPLLVCAAEHDTEADPKLAERVAATAPRGEFRLYPGGHFDAYHGETFERMVRDEAEFLQRCLL